jgi:chemotaxis protein MotB
MAARGRRTRRHDDHGEHVDERWLLTYSDLITLLMALFMVLFSISSVNTTKFEGLQHSLQDAFSGRILSGGQSIKDPGGTDNVAATSPVTPDTSSIADTMAPRETAGQQGSAAAKAAARAAAAHEQQSFEQLKARVDALARERGLSGRIKTQVTADGLLIRLLTDGLLFDSGQATPKPASGPLLNKLGKLLSTEKDHRFIVEGHTDNIPVSGRFPTNWELSTARAASVVRTFSAAGLPAPSIVASGRSSSHPAAPNTTPAGRSLNRRVEILIPRTADSSAVAANNSSILSQAP